ncbi:MAG: hypothetical protein KAW45_06415 [Thermoplasmatales archaeon]|nr:hypothetical protein [Thermoplasmatales archaeon]
MVGLPREHTVKVRAMNEWGAMSDWTIFEVSMPKNKVINTMPLFLRFLQQHPHLFPILIQRSGL